MKVAYFFIILFMVLITLGIGSVSAQSIPEWIKNTALWYGQGNISETEFLNAIKYLIDNEIIVLESQQDPLPESKVVNVIIPNGNANIENTGFYIPLNAQIKSGTTVVWINNDVVLHTIQSQDQQGNVIGLFNSAPLSTGQRFAYTFEEPGVYHYFCTLHPWRVGTVTVS